MDCLKPILLKPTYSDAGVYIPARKVPCGKCASCLRRKGNEWFVRLKAEYEYYKGNCYFVTLTYSPLCMPRNKNGVYTVCKSDVQRFFKRLRKDIAPHKIRYFLISEYTPENMLPHYHFLIYGFPRFEYDIEKCILKAWSVVSKGKKVLLGIVNVKDVTNNHIRYLSNYMCDNTWKPQGASKNFMLSSRRPGLGSCYLEQPNIVKYHRENLTKVTSFDGYKYTLPRFLVDKVFDDDMKQEIKEVNEKERYLQQIKDRIRKIKEYGLLAVTSKEIQQKEEFQRQFELSRKHNKKKHRDYE